MVEVEKNIQTNPIIQSLDPHRLMDPLQDGISELRLVQVMGSDLDVVNDARASFNRKRDVIDERDRQLIRFLIKERHTSPLRGIVFKFEMKMPYEDLRKLGVCKQEARGILPACVYTRVRWTVSAHALLWFVQLRSAEGAQTEIQKYSNALRELVMPYIPETIAAFDEFGL